MAITQFVAKVLLLDSNNDFLLLTRSDTHPTLAGFYDLPGGMIEDGEHPGEAAMRELQEETGLTIDSHNFKIMYATTMLLNSKSWPTLLYAVRLPEEKPSVHLSYEHKSYEWVPLDRLSDVEPQLAPTYRDALEYVKNHNILEDINWAN